MKKLKYLKNPKINRFVATPNVTKKSFRLFALISVTFEYIKLANITITQTTPRIIIVFLLIKNSDCLNVLLSLESEIVPHGIKRENNEIRITKADEVSRERKLMIPLFIMRPQQ